MNVALHTETVRSEMHTNYPTVCHRYWFTSLCITSHHNLCN